METPRVLINKEPLKHKNFDLELIGESDVIVEYLRYLLQWNDNINENENNVSISQDIEHDRRYNFIKA